MSKIVITAKVKIKEEFYLDVYEQLLLLYKHSIEEDGCIQFDLHNDVDDKNTFVFVETWVNQEALDNHTKSEHFISYIKKVSEKIEDLKINRLIKIEI